MIGQTISHYRITEKLGEGGMGVVYKAEDTELNRPVALKFLGPQLLRDEEGRKRFRREAQAAAALDHPNVCTVYEIGQADQQHFIAMAFLEGRPLSNKIAEGPLKLPEALSIATQMADGLEAAHEKGIVHRDIKPDNVMLMKGSRGLVKLMDFGLAQLAESSKLTREGTTLGTPIYMSPEQALGESTDKRSDIWALGVVLYEMVVGRPPFQGEVDQAVIYAIANESHEPLTAVRTGVPKELERVVDKCLAKNADERYQHVTDLLVDLQACRRSLEPQAVGAMPLLARTNRTSIFIGVAALVVACLGLAWWLARSPGPAPVPQYTLRQITRDAGYTGEPAISPDGKSLVYASDRSGKGNLDIWLHPLGGDPFPLTDDEADDDSPSFSPNDDLIVFRSDRDGGGIYTVPALGGPQTRIAGRGADPKFSPDGAQVSYWRDEFNTANQRFRKLWVVQTSGGEPRRIRTNLGIASPRAWSPDGQYLLVVGSLSPLDFGRAPEMDWWLVPLADGDAVPLGVKKSLATTELLTDPDAAVAGSILDSFPRPNTWLSHGNWIVFDAFTEEGIRNLWRVRLSPSQRQLVGDPQRLTTGIGEEGGSVALDGRIAFMNSSDNNDIWALPINANLAEVTGEPERIVSTLSSEGFPSISADGHKLVYTSDRAGNNDIWLRDLGSKEDQPVTKGPEREWRGVISPDGTKVVFSRAEAGKSNAYLADLRRSSERPLLQDYGSHLDFTPDGKRILYYTGSPMRWKTLDMETRVEEDLGLEHPEHPVHSVRFSPDQDWVAFKLQDQVASPVFVSPVIGGRAQDQVQWIEVAEGGVPSGSLWWSPDGNSVYLMSDRDGFTCLWARSLDPITKKPLGNLEGVKHFHGRLRFAFRGRGPFGYGLTADKHYMPLREIKANIYLAEPVRD